MIASPASVTVPEIGGATLTADALSAGAEGADVQVT